MLSLNEICERQRAKKSTTPRARPSRIPSEIPNEESELLS